MGLSPLDGHALTYLENNILKQHENWKYPLQSSYTQSVDGGNGGAPEKSLDNISDEGEKTRDQEKNKQ
jgi:hypothetical protein